ncbi:MAG: sugar phosphate isomerase/epimerase family protein, partial [Actinomycetota bacterium]
LPHDPDKALLFLLDALHVAAGVGSQWLTGALYGNLGTLTGHGPTDDEFGTIAKILHEVASHAHDLGISLGLEIINRFETYLVNTTSQVIDLLDLIDAPNVYAHLDTFHMNIEEGSFTEPVHRLGSRLGYVHLAESHRGIIGNGHIPFHELFAALRDINYDGPLIIEAFLNADPAIARATASWNTQDLDPETFVSASKAHIDQIRRAVATE